MHVLRLPHSRTSPVLSPVTTANIPWWTTERAETLLSVPGADAAVQRQRKCESPPGPTPEGQRHSWSVPLLRSDYHEVRPRVPLLTQRFAAGLPIEERLSTALPPASDDGILPSPQPACPASGSTGGYVEHVEGGGSPQSKPWSQVLHISCRDWHTTKREDNGRKEPSDSLDPRRVIGPLHYVRQASIMSSAA